MADVDTSQICTALCLSEVAVTFSENFSIFGKSDFSSEFCTKAFRLAEKDLVTYVSFFTAMLSSLGTYNN